MNNINWFKKYPNMQSKTQIIELNSSRDLRKKIICYSSFNASFSKMKHHSNRKNFSKAWEEVKCANEMNKLKAHLRNELSIKGV